MRFFPASFASTLVFTLLAIMYSSCNTPNNKGSQKNDPIAFQEWWNNQVSRTFKNNGRILFLSQYDTSSNQIFFIYRYNKENFFFASMRNSMKQLWRTNIEISKYLIRDTSKNKNSSILYKSRTYQSFFTDSLIMVLVKRIDSFKHFKIDKVTNIFENGRSMYLIIIKKGIPELRTIDPGKEQEFYYLFTKTLGYVKEDFRLGVDPFQCLSN
jgi:hypothetical protein